MSQSQGTTMITAAAAAGVLVAAGIAAVGSEEPTAAAPTSAPPVSSVAPYATPNTLYRPIVLTASGWSSQGVSGADGFVFSGGSDAVTTGGTAATGSPGGSTMFGTTLDAARELATFTGGDPAAAATLVGPTPSPFGLIGGAIAFFISDRPQIARTPACCSATVGTAPHPACPVAAAA
jgi:hypothetical protein